MSTMVKEDICLQFIEIFMPIVVVGLLLADQYKFYRDAERNLTSSITSAIFSGKFGAYMIFCAVSQIVCFLLLFSI